MSKNNVTNRNRVAGLFFTLADATRDRESRDILRHIGEDILHDRRGDFSSDKETAIEVELDGLREFAQLGIPEACAIGRERIRDILLATHNEKAKNGGKKMMKVLKDKIFGSKKKPVDKLAKQQSDQAVVNIQQAQEDIDRLTKQYSQQDAKRTALLIKYQEMPDHDSLVCQQLVGQINISTNTMKTISDQITMVNRVLQQNHDYFERIGRMDLLRQYAAMVPDAAKAGVLLNEIEESASKLEEGLTGYSGLTQEADSFGTPAPQELTLNPEAAAALAKMNRQKAEKEAAEAARRVKSAEISNQVVQLERTATPQATQKATENLSEDPGSPTGILM